MTRVKRGTIAIKKRRIILRKTKGFKWGRKSKERLAKEALLHAGTHAFNDRRKKKRDFRALWQTQIGAATRINGLSYSKFIGGMKKAGLNLNRKVLSEMAQKQPDIFKEIVESVKK